MINRLKRLSQRASNKVFLELKCLYYTDSKLWIYNEHPTHYINIFTSEHEYADYKIKVYDGNNLVSEFYTTNLWSI